MAEHFTTWLDKEVHKLENRSVKWLSELHFNRVEMRPNPIDSTLMFTPADGVIMDVHQSIKATEPFIEAKGTKLTLQDLMDDETFGNKGQRYLVVSVFMTFYSQHENYIPYQGYRTFAELPPISTFNRPMLKVEKALLDKVLNPAFQEEYLRDNGREINTIYAPKIGQEYHVVRVGDYDVDCFINYKQKYGEESMSYQQNERFGKISYGSQCILIVEQKRGKGWCKFELRPEAKVGMYVKCKIDPLVRIIYP